MRVLPDNSLPPFFTPGQRAFVEAWYSLTNAQSMDSHRVRTLNGRLVLRELVDVCHLVEAGIIHQSHREAIAQEAASVLEDDPIYRTRFPDDWRVLRTVLHDPACWKGDKAPRGVELRVLMEDALVRANAKYFEHLLNDLNAALGSAQPVDIVLGLISALLTDLTDRGFAVSNLYGFHKFFVIGNLDEHGNERTFDDRFRYLVQWLQRPKQPHEVVLRLSRAQKLSDLGEFGDWEFASVIPAIWAGDRREEGFLQTGAQVVFAKTTVNARDSREAGTLALRSWSLVTDQLLFDFIPQKLPYDSRFRCVRLSDRRVDIGIVEQQIPNPREWTSQRHLRDFSEQLARALSHGSKLRDEDKRQIEAAMRYFRLGTESESLEAAFLTRWIALESLLRTVHPDESIAGVCRCVSNLMGVTYLPRLNGDLSSTARYRRRPIAGAITIRLGMSDTGTISAVQFSGELTDPIRRRDFAALFSSWPLYAYRIEQHGAALADAKVLLQRIKRHEEHVQWQVQRMYRVRNEIVHSAGHSVPLLSLVSHLEYYLKTTARTIVRILSEASHIRSLRDLFHRIAARRTRLHEELKANTIPADLLDPQFMP
jgi:hypothetical protein